MTEHEIMTNENTGSQGQPVLPFISSELELLWYNNMAPSECRKEKKTGKIISETEKYYS